MVKKIDDNEEMDTSWIDDFKKENDDYSNFYTEEATTITIFFIYIDNTNNIEHLSRDLLVLNTKNTIIREELIHIIKQNQTHNNNKYKLISLLKYNIDIEPEEIYNFINNKDDSVFNNRFFMIEKYLNNIIYKNTINIFQDLNSLFFIFKEPLPVSKNNNKNSNNNSNNNFTKKINVLSKNHKTRRRKNSNIKLHKY